MTVLTCPSTEFSGRPPSSGGLNRVSRQSPVHVGDAGSMTAFANDSLYETSVRYGALLPSVLGS